MRNRILHYCVLAAAALLAIPVVSAYQAQSKVTEVKGPYGDNEKVREAIDFGAFSAVERLNSSFKADGSEGEVVDEYGIIISPAQGETKYYTRSGKAYYYEGNNFQWGADQSGHVTIVETEDGTVYVKDLISHYAVDSWVKGTKTDDAITIPVGQTLVYNSQYDVTLSLCWGHYDSDTYYWTKSTTSEIVFTIDGNTLTLQNSSMNDYIGAFWDGGYDSFSGYGDYETVWTLDENYEPASRELVELPDGLETSEWYKEGAFYEGDEFVGTATVAIDGNDFYVKGLFTQFPDSWIKGTIDGTTVTFDKFQFLGYYSTYPIWAVGYTASGLDAFTMTIDPTDNSYNADCYLLANAADDVTYYLEAFSDLTLMPEAPQPVFIDELPYNNHFESKADRRAFTIIDANEDQKTWDTNTNSGDTYMFYNYSSSNVADDWLISPAIKLEVGKHYHFAMAAWPQTSTYPERVEVMMGMGNEVRDMTDEVLPATDVTEPYYFSGDKPIFENPDFTVPETGYYYFGIHAISDANMYFLNIDDFLIELGSSGGSPAAVTDFTAVQTEGEPEVTLSFNAPSVSIDGDALTSNLTKIVIYRDDVAIATLTDVVPGSAQTYVDDQGLAAGAYSYYVVAYNDEGTGTKSEVITVFLTIINDIPALFDFNEDILSQCYVIDNNNDGSTWHWAGSYGAYYIYNGSNPGDDYLIMQPVRLAAGKSYKVTVNACSNGPDFPERFEVKVGSEPVVDALTITAIQPTEVTTEEYENFEGDFSVDADGVYYIALHAISNADMFRLMVKKVLIQKNPDPTSPAAPALEVVPDPQGLTQATVNVTAASTCINGDELTQNLSKLDVLRDDYVIYTAQDVAPGQLVTFIDETATKGYHTYQAIPYDQNGDAGQSSEKVTAYIGQDLPTAIQDVRYADNGSSVTLMWDKVGEVGQNEGYVNPALVDYVVSAPTTVEVEGQQYYVVGDEIGRVTDGDNFTVTGLNTDEGDQDFYPYYVRTENIAGATRDYEKYIVIGAPYSLPIEEHFENQTLHWLWDYSNNTSLQVSNESSDGDNFALSLSQYGTYGLAEFATGKICLAGTYKPYLQFDLKKGSADCNATEMKIFAYLPDGSTVDLQTVALPDEYTTINVSLDNEALKNARFVRIAMTVYFDFPAYGHNVLIDNILIADTGAPQGIESVMTDDENAGNRYFDIMGRRLNDKPQSGFYIHNGNKKIELNK